MGALPNAAQVLAHAGRTAFKALAFRNREETMDRRSQGALSRRALLGGIGAAAIIAGPAGRGHAQAPAQTYPSRTVKMVVPYPAGGITDVLPRLMQERLTRKWGQPIVVENKPGAAGNLGAEQVFNADPDGYTLMVTAPSPLTVNQSLYAKLPFDPAAFVPVTIMATIPTGLFVNPSKIKAATVAEFIAFAKANPGKITAATQGNGSTSHLTSEWFQIAAGVKFVQVPYRGSAPALQGLVAGDVDLFFDNLGVSLNLANEGKLKMLAVGTDKRMASLASTPTLAETLPGFVSSSWVGAFLPPKTPLPIADKLSADFAETLRDPEIAAKFRDKACEPVGNTPAQTRAFVNAESERWKKVIQAANIKL
jgi:tripartite-type tricarboxylate transporter receptor subunit TctC